MSKAPTKTRRAAGESTDKMVNDSQGKALPETLASGDTDPSVKDLPPANPLGEPVMPVEDYPNISEAGKQAAALGVKTEETGDGGYIAGETIVEHPVSPTDANPNPHGQRDSAVTVVPVKDADGNVTRNDPVEGDTEVEGLWDNPVHVGDGRTLAKGEKLKVSKEVAKVLRDNGSAK